MKKVFILSIVCMFLVSGCGPAKLQDGKEAVVSFKKGDKEYKIAAEDLFDELKKNFGLEATVKMIDTYILENEFKNYIDKAKEQAQDQIDSYIEIYGGEEALLEQLRQFTSYQTLEGYKESLYLSMMQNHAIEEYVKTLISDKDINNYYNDSVKGDVEVYQILIKPKVKDDMTNEEKEAKETEAKKQIEDIIKKLNDSKNKLETFKELAKEYSEDESSKKNDGNLGFINYDDIDDIILDEAYKLKNNDYSKKVISSTQGYHVIYRTSIKEKEALDKIKDKVIDKIVQERISENPNISLDSSKYYRKLYNMKINDSELDKQYGIYLNNLTNQSIAN